MIKFKFSSHWIYALHKKCKEWRIPVKNTPKNMMSFGETPLHHTFLQQIVNPEKALLIQSYAQFLQMQPLMFQFTSNCTAVFTLRKLIILWIIMKLNWITYSSRFKLNCYLISNTLNNLIGPFYSTEMLCCKN